MHSRVPALIMNNYFKGYPFVLKKGPKATFTILILYQRAAFVKLLSSQCKICDLIGYIFFHYRYQIITVEKYYISLASRKQKLIQDYMHKYVSIVILTNREKKIYLD